MSILNKYPELKAEWSPNNNVDLDTLTEGSKINYDWICVVKNCHEWRTSLANRIGNFTKCPCCAGKKVCTCGCTSLYGVASDLLRQEWDPANGDMKQIVAGSEKEYNWICIVRNCHQWKASPGRRIGKDQGCPFCAGQKVCQIDFCNSFYALGRPEIKAMWAMDEDEMKKHTVSSSFIGDWKCPIKSCHLWSEKMFNMSKAKGCPICNGKRRCTCTPFCDSVSMIESKKIKSEWDDDNPPMDETSQRGEAKRVWRCQVKACHGAWTETVKNRLAKGEIGCAKCKGTQPCEDNCNRLNGTITPSMKAEWRQRNGAYEKYTAYSKKRLDWLCEKENKPWWCTIFSRIFDNPICTNCSYFALVEEFIEAAKSLKIGFKKNPRYKDKTTADFHIGKAGKHARIFLLPSNYYNIDIEGMAGFIRITNKNKLLLQAAFDSKHSVLVITDLCTGNVKKILEEFFREFQNSSKPIYSFYGKVTEERILAIKKCEEKIVSSFTVMDLQKDIIGKIYSILCYYATTITSDNKLVSADFIECIYCNRTYFSKYAKYHYKSNQHFQAVLKHHPNVMTITATGEIIFFD